MWDESFDFLSIADFKKSLSEYIETSKKAENAFHNHSHRKVEEFTQKILGISSKDYQSSNEDLFKYRAHLEGYGGEVYKDKKSSRITLEGWHQDIFLFYRFNALLFQRTYVKKNSENFVSNLTETQIIEFLEYELWITINAFRIIQAYCKRVLNKEVIAPDEILKKLIPSILAAVYEAASLQEYTRDILCIPCGYQGHAVYATFFGSKTLGLCIRIDNLNAQDVNEGDHPKSEVKEHRQRGMKDIQITQSQSQFITQSRSQFITQICLTE